MDVSVDHVYLDVELSDEVKALAACGELHSV